MGLAVSSAHAPTIADASGRLSSEELINIYRLMYLSRRVDDREILLKRQQKIFFQISAPAMKRYRWARRWRCVPATTGSFRTTAIAHCAWRWVSRRWTCFCRPWARERIRPAADARCPRTGAASRCTSSAHLLRRPRRLLHAVGCAEAGRYFSHHPEAAAKAEGDYRAFHDVEFHGDEVVLTSLGEGSTSQGEFWEALNTASNHKLPVIFCVEDNGYAISVPVEVNTPGGNISRLVANFPNFYFAEIDGTDPVASLRAFQEAAAHCRAGLGPAFVHGHVHSTLLALALRRRQALPLDGRARGRRAARPAGQDADAPAARGHPDRRADQRARTATGPRTAEGRGPCARSRAARDRRAFTSTSTQKILIRPVRFCHRAGARAGRAWRRQDRRRKGKRAAHHGRPDQRLPARRDAPRSAHCGLWRRRGRRQPRRGSYPKSKARAASSS